MEKEKKEIWKLLELLNEYEKENWRNFEVKEIWMTYRNNDLMVISKRYWFVKWLVENDKIDKKKIRSPIMHYKVEEDRDGWIHYYDLDFADKTNSLLMLLSISSSPIEDLLLYLK